MGTWRAQRGLKVVEFVDRLTGVGYASWVIAGWSSPVARWAHNPKVAGSNPAPATIHDRALEDGQSPRPFVRQGFAKGVSANRPDHRWGQGMDIPVSEITPEQARLLLDITESHF